jgi:subtilisin family serine protease
LSFLARAKAKTIFFHITPESLIEPGIVPRIEVSLQWIIEHHSQYDIDIISLSWGSEDSEEWEVIRDEVQRLHEEFRVILIASAGNRETETYLYPASFNEFISVGGIFDDDDGYLTYAISKHFNYPGDRVTESKYMEYTEHPYEPRQNPRERPAGSTYNDRLDFVAPMFDIEVLSFHNTGNQEGIDDVYITWDDGTSFSAPMVAGVAALIFHAYYKEFKVEPTPIIIYEALRQTAEMNPNNMDAVPKPVINGKVFNVVQRSNYVGWGVIDAYDAILYIREKLGG